MPRSKIKSKVYDPVSCPDCGEYLGDADVTPDIQVKNIVTTEGEDIKEIYYTTMVSQFFYHKCKGANDGAIVDTSSM